MTDHVEDSFGPIVHSGYGPQILGPNYGDIEYKIEIDPNMRAMLTGVSEDAAKLVGLVKQALSDGFMSEYSVAAFNRTAQHISDDLVDRLAWATRNLSEDNVDQLEWATRNLTNLSQDNVVSLGWATRNITEETVNRLSIAAENISERTADRFDNVSNELNATVRRIEKALGSASVAQANNQQPSVIPPIPLTAKGTGKRGSRFKLILCISGLLLLAGVSLEKHHLGGWAVLAGVLALVIPALMMTKPKSSTRIPP